MPLFSSTDSVALVRLATRLDDEKPTPCLIPTPRRIPIVRKSGARRRIEAAAIVLTCRNANLGLRNSGNALRSAVRCDRRLRGLRYSISDRNVDFRRGSTVGNQTW